MSRSMLLHNCTVWQGRPPLPLKGWMLLRDGRVAQVGAGEPPVADEARDLGGRQVLPGFVDAHTHMTLGAWLPFALDARPWRSGTAALEAIRAAAGTRDDAWLLALGAKLDDWTRDTPRLAELDQAGGGRPVLIVDLTYHRALISSAGMARANLAAGSEQAGDVDLRRGRPTGQVWEAAAGAALHRAYADLAAQMGETGLRPLLAAEARRHLALGITAAHDPLIPPSMQPLMEWLASASPLRVSWSRVAERSLLGAAEVAELCPSCGAGPASAKLFTDGGHKCAMCFDLAHTLQISGNALWMAMTGNATPLHNMFRDRAQFRRGRFYTPYLRFDVPTLSGKLRQLGEHGVRPKVHAFGNQAVACACEALVAAGRPDATLEHLMFLDARELDAVADSGAVASLQPGLVAEFGQEFMGYKFAPRLRFVPLASLRQRGVTVALSSDHPCGSLDPLHNIRAAVSRRTAQGGIADAREAIPLEAAVEGYTTAGYQAIHGKPGPGLSVGAPADFVVVDGELMQPQARVVETWIGGRAVWNAG